MKKILIVLVLLTLCALVGFGYLLVNANSLITAHKGELEAAASKALGTNVTLGDINVSVFPSPKLLVNNFSIGEGAEFTKFSNLTVRIGLFPLLTGTLAIREVGLREPLVTLVKDKGGLRIAGLPTPVKRGPVPPPATPQTPPTSAKRVSSPIKINLDNLFLDNATVVFRDETEKREAKLISNLNLSTGVALGGSGVDVSNLLIEGIMGGGSLILKGGAKGIGSSSSPVDATLSLQGLQPDEIIKAASAFIPELPLTFGGTLNLSGNLSGSIQQLAFNASVDATDLAAEKVGTFSKKSGHSLKINSMGSVNGTKFTLKELTISPLRSQIVVSGEQDLSEKKGQFKLSSPALNLGEMIGVFTKGMAAVDTPPITLNADIATSPDGLVVPSLTGALFGGELNGRADLSRGKISSSMSLKSIDIASALASLAPHLPKIITGTLQSLNSTITGQQGADLTKTLSGTGDLLLVNGSIVGHNVAGGVLRAISSIPGVSGSLYGQLGEGEQAGLDSPDTPLQSAELKYTLGDSRLNISSLRLSSPHFDFSAKGTSSFLGAVEVQGEILFSKEISTRLGARSDRVKALLNREGRLPVPITITGTAPKLTILPDVERLLASAAGNIVKEKAEKEVGKLLDKAFGGSSKSNGKGLFGF